MKMKTTALAVVLPLCFPFSAITAKPLFAITGKDNIRALEPVHDIAGNKVLTNQTYYVNAYPRGNLTMACTSSNQLYVVQDPVFKFPLGFTLASTIGDVVTVSTDLYIKFAISPTSDCFTWSYNELSSCVYIATEKGVFQIIEVEDKVYKFALHQGSDFVDVHIFNDTISHFPKLCTYGDTFVVEFVKQS